MAILALKGIRGGTGTTSLAAALVLRDPARLKGEAALALWRDAMVASGITDKRPVDNDTFTRLTRNDVKADWLKRGIRSDAADRYHQQDINVTLTYNY